MQKLTYLAPEQITPVWNSEDLQHRAALLNKKHAIWLQQEQFSIAAGFNAEQLQVRTVLAKIDNSVIYPVECICITTCTTKAKAQEYAGLMLDYLDGYWAEYFDGDRDVFVPLNWSKHEKNDLTFYIRGFIRNVHLEAEADAFLAQHGHGEYDIHPISFET